MFHSSHWKTHRRVILAVLSLFLTHCSGGLRAEKDALSEWEEQIGCPMSHRQNFFNPYYTWVYTHAEPPSDEVLLSYLEAHADKLTSTQQERLLKIHRELIAILYSFETVEERLQFLAEMDLGASASSDWFAKEWFGLYGGSEDSNHCSPPPPQPGAPGGPEDDLPPSFPLNGHPRAWWGAMKAFATTYQSCDALYTPHLTLDDAPIEGLSFYGNHSTGRARLYTISNLERLLNSHPYLRSWAPADPLQCLDVTSSPLIYDFGGKPHVDPASPNELNFFKNAGTGSPALGLDCSAFVFSSLATAGLKVRSSVPLKGNHVYGINSAMFKSPERNGLDCLRPIGFPVLRALSPGDVVASSDHVFMVDQVGEDPFGVGHLSQHQCTLTHMDYKRFDFGIIQSSASKNFLGIHRMRAADYLATDPVMRRGLQDYALSLCHARFGVNRAPTRADVSVVRASTADVCTDQPLILTHQSCVKGCFDDTDIFEKHY